MRVIWWAVVLAASVASCGDSAGRDAGADADMTCPPSYVACPDEHGAMRCADVSAENCNCGGCGFKCGGRCVGAICETQDCNMGIGACPPPSCTAGRGVPYCANLDRDPDDCGRCGQACGDGETCESGECVASPPSP